MYRHKRTLLPKLYIPSDLHFPQNNPAKYKIILYFSLTNQSSKSDIFLATDKNNRLLRGYNTRKLGKTID